MTELAWQSLANCATTDPDAFFPDKGESSRPARKICGMCEVVAECLADALAQPQGQDQGIRGGLTRQQRDRMRGTA